ncbi:MAG: NAD(P)/FAD-dependent oxidoreductase [Flavisolibacter sp.]
MQMKTAVIIGGGAAGFFCAVNAARMNPNLHVIILEKSGKLLSKVKVSGGGRCNVTHACFDIDEMSRRYPRGQHFVKKAFHQFFTTDTIRWFEERNVQLKTEADGRMFPVTDNSETIIQCLVQEAAKHGVAIRLNAAVAELNHSEHSFALTLENGEKLTADFVCVAAGGYPKSSMFDWLKKTGHSIAEPVPSLFTFNLKTADGHQKHPITELMGVAVNHVKVKVAGTRLVQEGPLLMTHWGLSGPAVLRLSAWGARELQEKEYRFSIHINWLPHFHEADVKQLFNEWRISSANKKILNQNIEGLPVRLWHFLLKVSGVEEETRSGQLPSKAENLLVKNLLDYVAEVRGKTTFKDEFVTAGGIKLSEVHANSMMSKKLPNLFFAGEILDVDGITGGFNFQHAWTSGWIAAKAIAGS